MGPRTERGIARDPRGGDSAGFSIPGGLFGGVAAADPVSMSQDLRARNARRQIYLRALYQRVDSSVADFVDGLELGQSMGMDRAETQRVLAYLAEKGLIKVDNFQAGVVRLTASGVDHVEVDG